MADLFNLTISDASSKMAAGEISVSELLKSYMGQIDRVESSLDAWVTIAKSSALETATRLDRELQTSGPRSPLHGIPIGIKDIYYTKGMKTTACSKVYKNFEPTYDATAVTRLKEAGAIILGKTVTTEFAAGDPPPTINPWNSEHTPGGSSSGSAVAVAVRMCPAAMGSQTGGSIIRPAAYNGIVGLKPTFGRISCHGVIPVSWSLDTIGPMVNSVEDAALMLQVLAGFDPKDPGCSTEPVPDYSNWLGDLNRTPRIGLIREFFFSQSNPEVVAHTDKVIQTLSTAGAHIDEITLPPSFYSAPHTQWSVMNVECSAYHEEQFKIQADNYSNKLRERIEMGLITPATNYLQAQRLRRAYRRDMDNLAREWDVLLTPTTPTTAPRDLTTTGDPVFQSPWTSCGLPTITIPSGRSPSSGLPLGIQLIASSFAERRLLAISRWCEEILSVNLRPPEIGIS